MIFMSEMSSTFRNRLKRKESRDNLECAPETIHPELSVYTPPPLSTLGEKRVTKMKIKYVLNGQLWEKTLTKVFL